MVRALTFYYRFLKTTPTLMRVDNISGRPYYWSITDFHDYNMYYIYITFMDNCHAWNVAYFTKQSLSLNDMGIMCITLTKSLGLLFLFSLSIMYNCAVSLVCIEENGYRHPIGGGQGPDLSHFWEDGLIWLKSMWDDGGSIRVKMIEIFIMLALLKPRRWSCYLFFKQLSWVVIYVRENIL